MNLETGTLGALLDINNYLVVVLVVSFLLARKMIRPPLALALVATSAAPFFLNDVLFPTSYMPDQFVYIKGVTAVRSAGFEAVGTNNTGWASRLLALVPVPFTDTVRSLGFANKLLYCAMVVWLVRRYALRGPALLFILFYPSVVLYTGLSLRDTLIMLLMVAAVVFTVERRWVLAAALLVALALIKFQNAVILSAVVAVYAFYMSERGRRGPLPLLFIVAAGVAAFFALSMMYLDLLNLYRLAMVVEDGGRATDVVPITSALELASSALGNAIFFLLKPYPWAASNALQLIQSVENIFVAAFLFWFTLNAAKLDRAKALFWVGSLLFAFAVYGLVVANFGTAARYRFPFLIMYVVGLWLDVERRAKPRPAAPGRARPAHLAGQLA